MPFLARVPYVEGKELGQRVIVRAVIKKDFRPSEWIVIHLQPCPHRAGNGNVAVSVSIRFDNRIIKTLDRVNGVWTSNRNINYDFPVAAGEKLKVVIVADRGAYKININNKHFINHPYSPFKPRARFVRIFGPITLKQVTFQHIATPQKN